MTTPSSVVIMQTDLTMRDVLPYELNIVVVVLDC